MNLLLKLLFPPKCSACLKLLSFDVSDHTALCPDCEKLWESDALETCGACAKAVGQCSCLTERMQKARFAGFYKQIYYLPQKRTQVQNSLIYTVKQSRDRRTVDYSRRHG